MVKGIKYIKLIVLKFLLLIFLFLAFYHPAAADYYDTWFPSEQLFQSMVVPALLSNGDVLVDNFEYWDSPYNHGWISNEPPYPLWGYDIGYGRLTTVLDPLEVSRVLNVYRAASVFLPNFQRYAISRAVYSPDPDHPVLGPTHAYLSFKIRAPLSIELFDTFTFVVNGTLDSGEYYSVYLIPRETCPGCLIFEETSTLIKEPTDNPANPGIIEVEIGRQFMDWTWHNIYVDLAKVIEQSMGDNGASLKTITSISVLGNRYRIDDIIFHTHDCTPTDPPYLYKIGPIFAQLFAPMQRLIFATDDYCNQNDVLIDPNEIRQEWEKDKLIDPSIDLATIDCNIPVLADRNMRLSDNNHAEDMLHFTAYVGKGGVGGTLAPSMIHPLEVNPNDAYPLFLPAYYRLLGEDGDKVEPYACGASHSSEGTFYYSPERVRNIELALKNAGYDYWPRVAVLEFLPQMLEDLIVTVEVDDGRSRDIETFPVSVVNYPVENYPPCMEDIDDQIAYVGELFEYALSAVDPDSCIYSMTHPKPDQFNLTWSMTMAGLPSYQYGPWQEPLINPHTGLISFTPQFEGIYPVVVVVRDDRGFYNIGQFTLHCINSGTWFNHPPVVLGDWDHPMVCRAGELFILAEPTLDVEDPDGDKVYYTCNVGSIGTDAEGHAIWSFQPLCPGFYAVNIYAMDTHGAFTVFTIHVEVRPWWSM